jgi:hypothetical protein
MSKDTVRIKGGIIARLEVIRKENCDVSGSFGKYAFRATVYDTSINKGIMGSRVVSLEMWRAKKTMTGCIRVFPVLRCGYGYWTLQPRTKNDFKSSCELLYNLDRMLPKVSEKAS